MSNPRGARLPTPHTDSTRTSTLLHHLGVSARFDDGELVLDLAPQPHVLRQGVVRASVVSFLVDGAAGIHADDEDTGVWTLTSDLSVRMRPVAAPTRLSASNTVLRRGRRSVHCRVEVTADDGRSVASGAVGFTKIPRKDTDGPKPVFTPERATALFPDGGPLDEPLREQAGIRVIDPAAGIVEVLVTPELRNPAGTLQGALVALVAEAAAEELVDARFGRPSVVTDLDLRYLAQAPVGPVRSSARLLGDGPDAPILVELTDTSTEKLTTLVYARATILD
jgi:acyl-coenzyme A thioesterase PaaI-like protein